MAASGDRCNQILRLKANVYQIILVIHLFAIGNVKQATYFSVSGFSQWFLIKGTVMVYSHLWCVEKKIWFSLVLMLDVGDAVVCFLCLF